MRQRYDDFADWYEDNATRGIGLPFAQAGDRVLAFSLLGERRQTASDLGLVARARRSTQVATEQQPVPL